MHLSVARRGIQSPFMRWVTLTLGGRNSVETEYMRYQDVNAPRTYPPRAAPPSQNEKLHSVAYIYRDERRMVEPPQVVFTAEGGAAADVAPVTPGFGLTWSLNQEDPVVRSNDDFGLKEGRDYVKGSDF